MATMIRNTPESRRIVRAIVDSRRGGTTAFQVAAASGISEGATNVIIREMMTSGWLEVTGRGGEPAYALTNEGRELAERMLAGGTGGRRRWGRRS